MPAEQTDFFASLDFPGRSSLYLWEIAAKIGCSLQHLLNEIEQGALVGVDIRSGSAARRAIRVPVECYRAYILKRLTGPVDFKMAFLADLPAATRRQLIVELSASLKTRP